MKAINQEGEKTKSEQQNKSRREEEKKDCDPGKKKQVAKRESSGNIEARYGIKRKEKTCLI